LTALNVAPTFWVFTDGEVAGMKNTRERDDPDLGSATADAEWEFLSGGDVQALRWELDERLLAGRPPEEVPATRLLTPTGPVCC
jgi:hypothetical protein